MQQFEKRPAKMAALGEEEDAEVSSGWITEAFVIKYLLCAGSGLCSPKATVYGECGPKPERTTCPQERIIPERAEGCNLNEIRQI